MTFDRSIRWMGLTEFPSHLVASPAWFLGIWWHVLIIFRATTTCWNNNNTLCSCVQPRLVSRSVWQWHYPHIESLSVQTTDCVIDSTKQWHAETRLTEQISQSFLLLFFNERTTTIWERNRNKFYDQQISRTLLFLSDLCSVRRFQRTKLKCGWKLQEFIIAVNKYTRLLSDGLVLHTFRSVDAWITTELDGSEAGQSDQR